MIKVIIFIPVYYNEEDLAICLMKLIQCNFHDIEPTIVLAVTGVRDSFKESFLANYVKIYSKTLDVDNSGIFSNVTLVYSDISFDPTLIINDVISEYNEFDYIVIMEPKPLVVDFYWLPKLIKLFNEVNYDCKLGAICTNSKSHSILDTDKIKCIVNNDVVIKTNNGDGFGNGVMLTTKNVWLDVNGFKGIKYTSRYSKSCFRNGYTVVYAEDIR